MVRPAQTGQTRALNWFPFSNCLSFVFCRHMNFSACFNFFNFGCRTFASSFFPFSNRFNFNFNFSNSSMVNCIQFMRMPGGGTITIRVC